MNQFEQQLNQIIELGRSLRSNSQYSDLSDKDEAQLTKFLSLATAAAERISGPKSTYSRDIERFIKEKDFPGHKLPKVLGVVESLQFDVTAGYMQSVTELVHGELFGDFLEMASHLLDEGYKDASAVIAGSTLEGHLRQLCVKNSIPTDNPSSSGTQPKKADRLNSDLAGASVYSKLDLKNVTAWLDLRNKAAHGLYSEYTKEQVSLMIDGIRDFVTRNPA